MRRSTRPATCARSPRPRNARRPGVEGTAAPVVHRRMGGSSGVETDDGHIAPGPSSSPPGLVAIPRRRPWVSICRSARCASRSSRPSRWPPAWTRPVRAGGREAVPHLPGAAVVQRGRLGERGRGARQGAARGGLPARGRVATCSAARWTTRASIGTGPRRPRSRRRVLPRSCRISAAPFARSWAGVLPFTADNLPIIDALPGLDSVYRGGRPRVRQRGGTDDRSPGRGPRLRRRADHGPRPFRATAPGLAGPVGGVSGSGAPSRQRRIAFINPFGTPPTTRSSGRRSCPTRATARSVEVIHLDGRARQHRLLLPEAPHGAGDLRPVRRLEDEGYDAVVVGCCYDPGVKVARELVDIPVVGPLEAAMNHASYFGHRYTVITDHRKAGPGWRTWSGCTARQTAAASAPSTGT